MQRRHERNQEASPQACQQAVVCLKEAAAHKSDPEDFGGDCVGLLLESET